MKMQTYCQSTAYQYWDDPEKMPEKKSETKTWMENKWKSGKKRKPLKIYF